MNPRKVSGCPIEISDVDPEEISDVLDLFQGFIRDYIRVGPKGYFISKEYEKHMSSIYNLPLRSTDVFVVSYQRSGTTWTQELVWLIVNNLDYETAATQLLAQRYPFLDLTMFVNEKAKEMMVKTVGDNENGQMVLKLMSTSPVDLFISSSDPRFAKTHLPFSLLPPGLVDTAKVVYVARDPRDVVVSSYHHAKLFAVSDFTGDFKQFWNMFINNKFTLTPYFEHIKEAWALRHHPNMLFLFYEDLSKDLPQSLRKVASFFGKELTNDEISGLCEHLSIENFKNNKSVNWEEMRSFGFLNSGEKFIRTGKTGGWRDYFDEAMTKEAEQWISDNLRDTDLRYPSMNDIHI